MSDLSRIVTPLDLAKEVTELYRTGLPKGDSTGWPCVNEFYTISPGQWSLVTGIPGHGKSQWLDGLMMNLAKQRWRFVIFSPENQPLQLHIAKLLEQYTGKPFGFGPTERMSPEDMTEAMTWMEPSFAFLKPGNLMPVLTPRVVIESIAHHLNHDPWFVGQEKRGVVIDPWNELEHNLPSGMTMTQYISQSLSYFRQFAREYNVHLWIVAHPAKMAKDKDGRYPIPTPYDVSDSAHWRNKADNCITIWRDMANEDALVQVHVQKIRFRHIGKVGYAELRYSRVTGQYSDPNANVAKIDDYKRRASGDYEATAER